MIGIEDDYYTTDGDLNVSKPLSPVYGEECVSLPCCDPSSPEDSERVLLDWELGCRLGKGCEGESGGFGGNECSLPSFTLQMLLRNETEPVDLWGLMTKGKYLFLSNPRREQF